MNLDFPDLVLLDPPALAGMIDPARTALLVIDIQVDFAAPHGFFGRGGTDLSTVEPAIDAIERVIGAARQAGMPIVFVRAIDPAITSSAMPRWLERRGITGTAELCRAGSPGADYYRVQPEPGDIEIAKNCYDAFLETDLADILRQRGIASVIVTGVATDCCVDSTSRAAFLRDFDVFVVSDACAAGAPHLHFGALTALAQNVALLTDTAALTRALASLAPATFHHGEVI
jgi:nicotinamidase-related amidase